MMVKLFENIIVYNNIRFYSGLFKAENLRKWLTMNFQKTIQYFKLLTLKVIKMLLFNLTKLNNRIVLYDLSDKLMLDDTDQHK